MSHDLGVQPAAIMACSTGDRSMRHVGHVCLLLIAVAFSLLACELGGFPTIENKRDQDIRVYVTRVYEDGSLDTSIDYGMVPALRTRKLAGITFVKPNHVKRIEAVDHTGKVVFRKDFNQYELDNVSWRISIPP